MIAQDKVDPLLSVVVVIVSDTTGRQCDARHLENCLERLHRQADPPAMEVIVPHHLHVEGIDALKSRFPTVQFMPVADLQTFNGLGAAGREHHDELRARGLAAARGGIIALLEDHAQPDSNWARSVVRQHESDYAGVGGAIENGVERTLNWAVYFCDFGRYQNPVPPGESWSASDANVSYKRAALEAIRPVWQTTFHETRVNQELLASGRKLALAPDIVVFQHRSGLRAGDALMERFVWGRSYAGTRSADLSSARRLLHALLSPALPAVLLFRMASGVARKRRNRRHFLAALPWTAALVVSWSIGEAVGYITGAATAQPDIPTRTRTAPAGPQA